ncbi:MAG: HTTM domain-containing protein [Myxococcota bacterium]
MALWHVKTSLSGFCKRAQEPMDGLFFGWWRIFFGGLLCFLVLRFFLYGWIDQLYIRPRLLFPYEGFFWLPRPSSKTIYMLFTVMGICAFAIMLGFLYRLATFGFLLLFAYVELLDKTNYLNHYYFLLLLCGLMLFMPFHRRCSIDAWLWKTRQPWTRGMLWLLCFQVGIVYCFAGVAKLNSDWLLHAEPLRTWLVAHVDVPVLGRFFALSTTAFGMSWAGAFFDLSIVFFLLCERTRSYAFGVVVIFHLMTWKLFYIGLFPWFMMGGAALFFAHSLPSCKHEKVTIDTILSKDLWYVRVYRTARHVWVALYLVTQCLFPLRHHLYPGWVCWTEEGFRFSWNVMLIEKNGHVDFWVVSQTTQRRWLVSPRTYLTPLQVKMMSTQPDMILYFAHWLAEQYTTKFGGSMRVFADAWVSLNGRTRQRFIDPHIDLRTQPLWSWQPRPWIAPFSFTQQRIR